MIESQETAYNLTIIMPCDAGNGRKNARNFKLEALHPVPFIAEALRWLMAIFEAYAEKTGKRWKVTTTVMVCWMSAVSFLFLA